VVLEASKRSEYKRMTWKNGQKNEQIVTLQGQKNFCKCLLSIKDFFIMVVFCSRSKTYHYLNVTCSRHSFLSWLSFSSLCSFVSRRSFLALKGRKFKILTSQETKACLSEISCEGFIFVNYVLITTWYTTHRKTVHAEISIKVLISFTVLLRLRCCHSC